MSSKLFFFLLILPLTAPAQQVLVQADVAADTARQTFGPNRRYFGHLHAGLGLVLGPAGAGAPVRYGPASFELGVGGRLKRRLSQTLALNADLRYALTRYALAQTAAKTIPAPAQHLAEALVLHQLQPELSLRLNAGRRGNSVGRYLDLLAYGSWAFVTQHRTDDEPAPGVRAQSTTASGLPYLRRLGGGLGARLGTDRYALVARYRLGSAWAPAYAAWPALPRWVVGLEVGWF